ncbi:MAG: DUF5107 domain-containing protein [Planctomycetia bacterium]|nr:DUF5107 domain-containing protein [Planctomycetia bacterium]
MSQFWLKQFERFILLAAVCFLWELQGSFVALGETSFREYQEPYSTYPFDDPNPIPEFTDFYPYFRFDGFFDKAKDQDWKVVELSNDYLVLKIFPEIGGKIWTATEKSTGKSFIYSNPVIKFRDIAMRGPWTSGGLETNIGIIGHTPNCSSPVDYFVRRNDDGSVSCFIGALDLITQSRWTVEINLPDQKAVFSTRVFWHNSSGLNQPYYTWMNVGAEASDDLQFVNFGTNFVGHDGEIDDWPINHSNGKDLSLYRNNDFGRYKSYHIIGRLVDFFGAYYHNDDFGIASVIPIEGKRGRKIWIWGLSREGMIWQKLLTDPPAQQYVEIQTGRLFNQTSGSSSQTPFKHREFAPASSDSWIEYWMPVQKIKGFNAASPTGTMNVSFEENEIVVRICPVQFLDSSLKIYENDQLLSSVTVSLEPMKPWEYRFTIDELNQQKNANHLLVEENKSSDKNNNNELVSICSNNIDKSKIRIVLGENDLVYYADDSQTIVETRPWTPEFQPVSEQSPTYHYLNGLEKMRQRKYKDADLAYEKCLSLDPLYINAYSALAENAYRRAEYQRATDYCRKALSIDLYDATTNYYLGKSQAALGNWTNAKEAFCVAVLSDFNRSASLTELAKIFMRENDLRTFDLIEQALDSNRQNLIALHLKLSALRKEKTESRQKEFYQLVQQLLEKNPLDHFVRFELYLADQEAAETVCDLIRWELPHETFLETALFYDQTGQTADAISILNLALKKEGINRTEILYWLAFLTNDLEMLRKAEQESPDFCFPFRKESLLVFQWANQNGSSWKNAYYLAILEAFLGHLEEAQTLLASCENRPDYPPFYIFRGRLIKKNRLNDYRKAFDLAPNQARYAVILATELQNQNKTIDFFPIVEEYVQRFPLNAKLILLYAQGLMALERQEEAFQFLKSTVFLPNEGSLLGRNVYHEAALVSAACQYANQNFENALQRAEDAKIWPENLGSGKPYNEYCDERLEDLLIGFSAQKLQQPEKATKAFQRVLATELSNPDDESTAIDRDIQRQTFEQNPFDKLFSALALREIGKPEEARQRLENWIQDNQSDEKVQKRAQWSLDYFDDKSVELLDASLTEKILKMIQ